MTDRQQQGLRDLRDLVVRTAAERDAARVELNAQAWKYLQECGAQARRADAAELALATARAEQIRLLQQVSVLTNERDNAVARAST